jgi:hypothetical protein
MSKEPLIKASGRGADIWQNNYGNALIVIGSRKDRGGMSKIARTKRQSKEPPKNRGAVNQ